MNIVLVALYLVLTVSGLVLYKFGANQSFALSIGKGSFTLNMSLISVLGLLCYLFSFLLYMLVLPRFDLSFIMPFTSAITYIAVFVLSSTLLKEAVSTNRIIGAAVILVGIILMNIKK